jgi:hypothetical protein
VLTSPAALIRASALPWLRVHHMASSGPEVTTIGLPPGATT